MCGIYFRKYYSENAWVCGKWQWNARDCVTGLHDWWSRECNPVTPVECVSLSFCTHPCVLVFITHILCINGIEMTFVWLICYTLHYIFFKFAICFIALMNLGETYHLKTRDSVTMWRRCCCYVVTIVTAYSSTMMSCSLNTCCDVLQCMNGLWIFENLNPPRAIHKHNPHPLETLGHVW